LFAAPEQGMKVHMRGSYPTHGFETAAPGAALLAFCAALLLPAAALAQTPAEAPAQTPAAQTKTAADAAAQSDDDIRTGKVCANCHADAPIIWGGKHGTKADARTPIANLGCATCHGDPTEHLKSPANPMPNRFDKMTSEQKNDVCMLCHQGRGRIHWAGSAHARNDVACTSCHQLHTAADPVRDKLTQPEVCFTCHKVQRAQINRPSRHPIREGLVACSDCHNAHGSVGPSMLIRDNINDTCYMCHMEKRGPFVRTHQPVQENCALCHEPHGTTVPNLLRQRSPWLCQECHEPTSHRGNFGSLAGTSTGANTLARGCVNCHTNIHGSNNPSDDSGQRTFRR
jgi:DmsE family decaheme c-type cytochrome